MECVSWEGPEGKHGGSIELYQAIDWPKGYTPDKAYIMKLLCRMRACAHRDPDLLPLFGMSRASLSNLISDARALFSREGNVEMITVPNATEQSNLHVLGDLHGDLFSLLKALSICGMPAEENRIVIAGDMVDRGCWGCEILICVFALKIWQPKNFALIRGNHETTSCTSRYGFQSECSRKYGLQSFKNFMSAFRELPLAIVTQSLLLGSVGEDLGGIDGKGSRKRLKGKGKNQTKRTRSQLHPWDEELKIGEKRVLVVHGGLWRRYDPKDAPGSMTMGTLTQLWDASRPGDDPEDCAAEDVLWSDPASSAVGEKGVRPNTMRGAGVFYGSGAVDTFLRSNKLCAMIRAHEGPDARKQRPEMNDMEQGYSVESENCFTVFSAARYAGHSNQGAVATFGGRRTTASIAPKFTTYDCDDRPSAPAKFFTPDPNERPSTPFMRGTRRSTG